LSPEQAAGFHEQMRLLVESQLSLERIVREVTARPSWFADGAGLERDIGKAEGYVNNIIAEWEEQGGEIIAGVATGRIQSLGRLQAFLGRAKADVKPGITWPLRQAGDSIVKPMEKAERVKEAEQEISHPLKEAEGKIRLDLYGPKRVGGEEPKSM